MHRTRALAFAIILTLVAAVFVAVLRRPAFAECSGTARCFADDVVRVIDGDTIVVGTKTIRLVLVDTPERSEAGYEEAKDYVTNLCLNQHAIIDQDDLQYYDSYGRMLAVVYCNGVNVNAALLENDLGKLYQQFCDESEFAFAEWATRAGCWKE